MPWWISASNLFLSIKKKVNKLYNALLGDDDDDDDDNDDDDDDDGDDDADADADDDDI